MPKTLQELLFLEFGVATYPRFSDVGAQVTPTVSRVFDPNPNRLAIILFNLGLNDLFVGFDREISSTRGMLISNGGGGFNLKWREEFNLVGHDMYAVAPAGASAIFTVEVVTKDPKAKDA